MAAKGSTAKVINFNARIRKFNGKIVKACLYNGRAIGHGKYFAAEIDGDLVVDENGKPVPFQRCGQLEPLVSLDKNQ